MNRLLMISLTDKYSLYSNWVHITLAVSVTIFPGHGNNNISNRFNCLKLTPPYLTVEWDESKWIKNFAVFLCYFFIHDFIRWNIYNPYANDFIKFLQFTWNAFSIFQKFYQMVFSVFCFFIFWSIIYNYCANPSDCLILFPLSTYFFFLFNVLSYLV